LAFKKPELADAGHDPVDHVPFHEGLLSAVVTIFSVTMGNPKVQVWVGKSAPVQPQHTKQKTRR
jgi:hypothetical protein